MGCVQPGTRRGTFLQMIGSRKITPPRMLRMVPVGGRDLLLSLKSFTRPHTRADGAVRGAVHLLELDLLHPRLVGRDGRAFDGDADPLGRLRGVDRDLVAG